MILIWIIFAITLIITISLFLTVLTAMFLFGTIIDLNIKSSINKLNVEGDIDFSFKYDVKLEFNEFIDFYIPTLDIFLNMSGFSVEISLNIFSINLEIIDFSVDLLENIDDNGLGQSAIHHLKSSSISSTIEGITDFIFGVGLTLSILGGFVGFYTATLAVVDEAKRDILYILGTIAYVLTIVILILTIICLPDTFSVPYIFGMATGCIISGLVFLFVSRYIKNPHKYMYQLKKFFGGEIKTTEILVLFKIIKLLISGKNIVDFLLKIFNIKGPIADNELRLLKKARSSFITGSFAMFLGSAGIILLGNRNRKGKSKLAILFCVTSLIGGSVLIGIGKWRLNN